MISLLLDAARASGQGEFMWSRVEPLVATLFNEEDHASLKLVVIRVSPHLPWLKFTDGGDLVRLWIATASVVPYTDETGQAVIDTLLQITSCDSLRPHVPVGSGLWTWLNRLPSLPPVCWGRHCGNSSDAIRTVRALGDVETLKSYLLLVLSEWDSPDFHGVSVSFGEDFGGIGMWHHRKDILRSLNRILGQLEMGLDHLRRSNPNLGRYPGIWRLKRDYEELKLILLRVDREANDMLTREPPRLLVLFGLLTSTDMDGYHSAFMCALPLPCP